MTTSESLIFAGMVFIAILLLATAMIVPTAGTAAQASRKMRSRMRQHLQLQDPGTASLIRDQYLSRLSPLERVIEEVVFFQSLSRLIEQSGDRSSVARVLLKCLVVGLVATVTVFLFSRSFVFALLAGGLAFFIPILLLMRKRANRMDTFEEQLTEALSVMSRALKAGHPLLETFNIVSEEMDDPISTEFGRVFSDLNYGMPLKAALQSLLVRMPSMSLHSLITAVLIQSETGGALAEILDNVLNVIRSRFKLQRKIKTYSAEGRLSAWILGLIPFILAGAISITSPDYLPLMLAEPLGQKMVLVAFVMLMVGVFWIRKLIQIEV